MGNILQSCKSNERKWGFFLTFQMKKKCFSQEYNKLIIIYNFDKDKINIKNEKEKFEKYFKEFHLIESGWLLTDQNREYLTHNEWIEFKNNFEFVLE